MPIGTIVIELHEFKKKKKNMDKIGKIFFAVIVTFGDILYAVQFSRSQCSKNIESERLF